MREVRLTIDGVDVAAQEGMTLLPAARGAGVSIPTLCHHDKLEPFGSCRLCLVEVESRGRTSRVASCVYPVENQLVVRTRSETIDPIRKAILDLYLAHAPDSPPGSRHWPACTGPTGTGSRRKRPFASTAGCVCATAPR